MSYFRWRQAPFAQEQTHTGLLLSNGDDDVAADEIATLNRELDELAAFGVSKALQVHSDIAIVFSYAGIAIQDIQLPGGSTYSPLGFCQRVHSACRQWGVNVDIVSPTASLAPYRLILVCTSTEDDAELVNRLQSVRKDHQAVIALFPGTGSRSHDYTIPEILPPGHFQSLLPLQIIRSESLPSDEVMKATGSDGTTCSCAQWRERIASDIEPRMRFADDWGFHYEREHVHYINAIPEKNALVPMIGDLIKEADIPCRELGPYLRTQRVGPYQLAFNFGRKTLELDKALGTVLNFHHDTRLLVGSRTLGQAEVAAWVAG